MLQTVFGQLFILFVYIAIGYLARRRGWVDPAAEKGLSQVVVSIALPAFIVSCGSQPFDASHGSQLVWVFAGTLASYVLFALAALPAAKLLRLHGKELASFCCLCIFANVGYIGFPVVSVFLPGTGVVYTAFVNLAFQLVFFLIGVPLLTGQRPTLRSFLGNPNILAIALMATLFFTQTRLPAPAQSLLTGLGALCTPLSMLLIGMQIGACHMGSLLKSKRLLMLSAVRLLAAPLLILLLALLLGAPRDAALVLIVTAAMPCASISVMVVRSMDGDALFASQAVLHSTVLFITTMPLITAALGLLLA